MWSAKKVHEPLDLALEVRIRSFIKVIRVQNGIKSDLRLSHLVKRLETAFELNPTVFRFHFDSPFTGEANASKDTPTD
jgi:hypothetical protein